MAHEILAGTGIRRFAPVGLALVVLFSPPIGDLWNATDTLVRVLSSHAIASPGHISYVHDFVHAIVQKFPVTTSLNPALHAESNFWSIAAFVLYLFPSLFAASLYQLVEEPCRKWIRHHWRSEAPVLPDPIS